MKRLLSFICTILLVISFLIATVYATPPAESPSLPMPGDDGFVLLENKVEATTDPTIFKITQSVTGKSLHADPPRVGIIFMVDNSYSMNDPVDGSSVPQLYLVKQAIINSIDDYFFNPAKNPSFDRTYIGGAFYTYYGNHASLTDNSYIGLPISAADVRDPSLLTGITTAEFEANGISAYWYITDPLFWGPRPNNPIVKFTPQNMVGVSDKTALIDWFDQMISDGPAHTVGSGSQRMNVLPYVYQWFSDPAAATGNQVTEFDSIFLIHLADGLDQSAPEDSISWFQAIQGPSDIIFHYWNHSKKWDNISQKIPIGPGLNGTVLSIGLKLEGASYGATTPSWPTDYLAGTPGLRTSIANPFEEMLITSSVKLTEYNPDGFGTVYYPENQIDSMFPSSGRWCHKNINNPAWGPQESATWWAQTYGARTDSGEIDANYVYANSVTQVEEAFENYAKIIVDSLAASVVFESQLATGSSSTSTTSPVGFKLYQMPGQPMFTYVGPAAYVGVATAHDSDTRVSWDIAQLPPDDETISLIYYIKITTDISGLDGTYNVFDYSYADYTFGDEDYIKYAPIPTVKLNKKQPSATASDAPRPTSPIITPHPSAPASPTIPASDRPQQTDTSSSELNSVILPLGTTIPIYTASTPQTVLYDEEVEESTDAIPVTGQAMFITIILVGTLLLAGIIIFNHRKNK